MLNWWNFLLTDKSNAAHIYIYSTYLKPFIVEQLTLFANSYLSIQTSCLLSFAALHRVFLVPCLTCPVARAHLFSRVSQRTTFMLDPLLQISLFYALWYFCTCIYATSCLFFVVTFVRLFLVWCREPLNCELYPSSSQYFSLFSYFFVFYQEPPF